MALVFQLSDDTLKVLSHQSVIECHQLKNAISSIETLKLSEVSNVSIVTVSTNGLQLSLHIKLW